MSFFLSWYIFLKRSISYCPFYRAPQTHFPIPHAHSEGTQTLTTMLELYPEVLALVIHRETTEDGGKYESEDLHTCGELSVISTGTAKCERDLQRWESI